MLFIINRIIFICWLVDNSGHQKTKGEKNKVVKIGVELYSEPKEGEEYIITGAVEKTIKTNDGEKPAIVVSMVSNERTDKTNYSVTLWISDNASLFSKLGSFVSVLGNDTDKYENKRIKILCWQPKQREIKVLG